ncbi:MAG: NADH:flavin oxidoreductase [Desulfobacteraceae bacterium]|nr:NADH:flavin oxidoreductase [Desulfobacteraceae bacterium]
MSKLFETTSINNMTLQNRFVRSATWEGMANDDGSGTTRLADYMKELARGGLGLIITGHAYVAKGGQAGLKQLGAYSDELLPGLNEITEAVRKQGGKIVLQLAHAGCHAASNLSGLGPVGPSVMENENGPVCREITQDDIRGIVNAFRQGASLAERSGFDGVQIHGAHGYLLSQFLSPYYNKREDEYGGAIENRARIILEVLQSIRAEVGDKYPVMIKMNSEDFLDNGLNVEDMLQVAEMLEKSGIDAIELSGGTSMSGKYNPVRRTRFDSEEKEVFYKSAAERYKEKIRVPLMLVGGIRSYSVAEQLVNKGTSDYIALCRPLIREPHLINRWKSGDTAKATCLTDNKCFKPAMEGKGLYCVNDE